MSQLRYDNRVVVVTGAGGGLGKAYALAFAARGAKVVVNDLGTAVSGEGKNTRAADAVVEEIRAAGGEAVANYDSVTDGEKIIKTAVDRWNRVDIVINNAGVLRDVTFMKMTEAQWDIIYKVHLYGAYSVTRAAWNVMREQGFGRVIMTTSAAGLYGNFGQANYSAAKLALVGLANTLSKEGEKRNVFVNTIAPLAATRMTENILPPDLFASLKAEYIVPLVLYLCHEHSKANGQIFEVGAGWVAQVRWQRAHGAFLPVGEGVSLTPEQIRDAWSTVTDFAEPSYPISPQEAFGPITQHLEKLKSGGSGGSGGGGSSSAQKGDNFVDVPRALAHRPAPVSLTYSTRDVILYALSVGFAANSATCGKQLSYTYENSPDFRVAPTFAVTLASGAMSSVVQNPGLGFNPMMLLHGEQAVEFRKPLPTAATVTSASRIVGIYDKGKGAVVVVEAESKDEKGETLCVNRSSLFIRGLGGFGGDRGPAPENTEPPARAPDQVQTDKTNVNQALFYRWTSGDLNPLHADPSMAAIGGFDKPILHGLCSFGFAGRAVLQHFAGWDDKKLTALRVRFTKHVFPGETLTTEMWKVAPNRVLFRTKVEERNEYVLSGGVAEFSGTIAGGSGGGGAAAGGASKAAGAGAGAAAGGAGEFKSAAIFADLNKKLAAAGAAAVQKVSGIYQFDITKDGKTRSWGVDVKTGPVGKLIDGAPPKADVTLTLSDDDCFALFSGKLNPQQAFMQGKLKIKGDMKYAMKLGQLIGPAPKL